MAPKTGIATKKTADSFKLIDITINKANIIIIGPLTKILIIIWKAICTLVTSVVIRVTKLEVENLSIFSKE